MPNLPDYRSRFLFSFKPSSLPAYLERITWRKSLAQQQITVPWPYISLRRENRQTNTRYPNHEAATQSLSVVRNVLLLDQMITLLCLEQTWLCTSTMVRPKSNWMYSSTSKAITLSIRNGHNMAYITVQISSFSPYHMLHLHPETKYSCFKSLEVSSPWDLQPTMAEAVSHVCSLPHLCQETSETEAGPQMNPTHWWVSSPTLSFSKVWKPHWSFQDFCFQDNPNKSHTSENYYISKTDLYRLC